MPGITRLPSMVEWSPKGYTHPDYPQYTTQPIPIKTVQRSQQLPKTFEDIVQKAREEGRIRIVGNTQEWVVIPIDRKQIHKLINSSGICEAAASKTVINRHGWHLKQNLSVEQRNFRLQVSINTQKNNPELYNNTYFKLYQKFN